RAINGGDGTILEDVDFRKALVVAEGDRPTRVQVRYRSAEGQVEVAARDDAGEWSVTAVGAVRAPDGGTDPLRLNLAALQSDLTEEMDGDRLAVAFAENGLNYGPAFRGLERAWRQEGEALGRIIVPQSIAGDPDRYIAHPALLDACLQVLSAALP